MPYIPVVGASDYDVFHSRARLINGLLSALSEAGFRVDIWLNDIALVLIMIWIVLSEPDRYTKDSLLAPDHLFLGSLDEDALELVKSINPSSAVGTTFSSQVKTNSAIRFGKVYWLVRAAFLLIVDPLASSKMHKSLLDCISPSQLLQAAVGHAPWLEGAAMTIKKIEDAESNIGKLVILKQEKIDITSEKLGTPEHDRDVPPQVRYQRPLLNPASAQQLVNPKSEKHSEIGRSPISGSLQSSQRYMRYRYL
ncbi:hypothetical protein FRC02_002654 [Tulasnella sp. 418]|nr:hypothetical protein FRC02_002654 [Tulasnella sp. 418]